MTTPKQVNEASGLNRRAFLKRSAVAAGGAAAVGGGLGMSVEAWAATLDTFDAHQAKTLLKMGRDLYPHPSLGDFYYANLVADLDADASDNADTAKMMQEGIALLDGRLQTRWVEQSDRTRHDALVAIESTPFFQAVRGKGLTSIYNNPLVWRELGYEGASAHLGGYINRGFDDLHWLAQPEEDASPAVQSA